MTEQERVADLCERLLQQSDRAGYGQRSEDESSCLQASAELKRLAARCDALEEALGPFARCPTHGKDGGAFIIAHAFYADMKKNDAAPRAAYWHDDDFRAARAALGSDPA